MTVAHQAPLSTGFPRQQCWTGLLFPSPGDLPNPRIESISPAFAGGFFTTHPPGKPRSLIREHKFFLPGGICCCLWKINLGCINISSFQSLSHAQLFAAPWTAAHQASLSITNSQSLLKLIPIELMISNHLILCHPILPLLSIFPRISVYSNESALHIRWAKYWSFSFIISPSSKYSRLISLWIDWLDLLALQGILKSLCQHQSSKVWILQHSAFFMVQLSHPYMTTGKNISLTTQTFVGKVMSLLFNMLSRFVIVFLPRSRNLLISWLQSPSAGILKPKKIKSSTVSIVSLSICHEMNGTRCCDLSF